MNFCQRRHYFRTGNNRFFIVPMLVNVFGEDDTVVVLEEFTTCCHHEAVRDSQRDQRKLYERNYTVNAHGMSVTVFLCVSMFQFREASQISLCFTTFPTWLRSRKTASGRKVTVGNTTIRSTYCTCSIKYRYVISSDSLKLQRSNRRIPKLIAPLGRRQRRLEEGGEHEKSFNVKLSFKKHSFGCFQPVLR